MRNLFYYNGMVKEKKNKVFVGLSGGVDSAVSAGLLLEQGFDVTGVFIKVWQPDWIECNWKQERLDAMRVCAHFGIPFITLDLENEYKKEVIDYMIAEYSKGQTPNPDVMCNRYVKFGGFLKWAREQGADFVATGHYARVVKNEVKDEDEKIINNYKMLVGVDQNKDQSYFLWTLNQNDLKNILFPVGHLTKTEVRVLAKKFELPNFNKKDSQGLCFIGKLDVKEFLKHYIKTERGDVLNDKGQVIGHHDGSFLFTKGERHGFTITKKTPNDQKYFVIDKDLEKNTITVSNRIDEQLPNSDKKIKITNVNWVGERPQISSEYKLGARSRYRQPLQKIRFVSIDESGTEIEFENVQDTISAGQSLVIYDGENCIGGGVIG